MIKGYKGVEPKIDETAFIADSADVIGQVNIGKNANIWYGTVLRADDNHITVGENTNIQEWKCSAYIRGISYSYR